ncbi:hypothetical protein FHS24_002508, partial [Psychrobacter luti]|nr:hypothetical protein [Psychrobacter luti]
MYDGNGAQGTYGATKGDEVIPEPPVRERGEKSTKTGAQTVNVGGAFITSTREFDVYDNGNNLDARADTASDGGLPIVPIFVSGDNDVDLGNGYMSNVDDEATITIGEAPETSDIPLTYTSVYKDFGGDMRVGHINGAADATATLGAILAVDGVAVVGNATANMPTEGVFNYAGDATNRLNGIGNAIEYGTSVFTADFVNSNIQGTLSFATAGDIDLTAGITGNQFSGAAADNAGYNTQGGFYGDNGQYLGGVYDGNGAQGTYGATKGSEVIITPPPANPDAPVDSEMTGVQSFTLTNADAIGFRSFWDDKDNKASNDRKDEFTNTRNGNNFTAFDTLTARADLTKPDTVKGSVTAKISSPSDAIYNSNTKGFKVYNGSAKVDVAKPISTS